MKSLMVLVSVAATLFPLQVLAGDNLIGEYDGKVKYVEGHSGKAGDACVASITPTTTFSGSLKFSLNDAETFEFDQKKINDLVQSGKKQFALKNVPAMGKDGIEILNLSLRENGTLSFLKLSRIVKYQHSNNKVIACSGLKKR